MWKYLHAENNPSLYKHLISALSVDGDGCLFLSSVHLNPLLDSAASKQPWWGLLSKIHPFHRGKRLHHISLSVGAAAVHLRVWSFVTCLFMLQMVKVGIVEQTSAVSGKLLFKLGYLMFTRQRHNSYVWRCIESIIVSITCLISVLLLFILIPRCFFATLCISSSHLCCCFLQETPMMRRPSAPPCSPPPLHKCPLHSKRHRPPHPPLPQSTPASVLTGMYSTLGL